MQTLDAKKKTAFMHISIWGFISSSSSQQITVVGSKNGLGAQIQCVCVSVRVCDPDRQRERENERDVQG